MCLWGSRCISRTPHPVIDAGTSRTVSDSTRRSIESAVNGHAGHLRMTRSSPELLGVEVQPLSVGGILGTVEVDCCPPPRVCVCPPAEETSASRPGAERSVRGSSTKASVLLSGLTPCRKW